MREGDWYGKDKRFGVMCVHGYSDAAGSYDSRARSNVRFLTFDFHVVDLHREGEVIGTHRGSGTSLHSQRVQAARTRAIRRAAKENRAESRAMVVQ